MGRKKIVQTEEEKAEKKIVVQLANVELDDYSDYEEFVRKPTRCLAKRLTEDEEIDITINGIPDKFKIRAGEYKVVLMTSKGNVSKITGYSEDEFNSTWFTPKTQGKLVFKKDKGKAE